MSATAGLRPPAQTYNHGGCRKRPRETAHRTTRSVSRQGRWLPGAAARIRTRPEPCRRFQTSGTRAGRRLPVRPGPGGRSSMGIRRRAPRERRQETTADARTLAMASTKAATVPGAPRRVDANIGPHRPPEVSPHPPGDCRRRPPDRLAWRRSPPSPPFSLQRSWSSRSPRSRCAERICQRRGLDPARVRVIASDLGRYLVDARPRPRRQSGCGLPRLRFPPAHRRRGQEPALEGCGSPAARADLEFAVASALLQGRRPWPKRLMLEDLRHLRPVARDVVDHLETSSLHVFQEISPAPAAAW